MSVAHRVRVEKIETLSDNWYVLRKATFDFLRSDGTWQRQAREAYDRGNGATILLYHRERRTVILTRQFRYPAFSNGYDELLIETPGGLLDENSPEETIRREAMEETGYEIHDVKKIFDVFMSPGSVTERVYFFVAEYDPAARQENGGGLHHEGEDIDTLELPFDDAYQMIHDGRIRDGKTVMLLQHAKLHIFT
jgi:nudix-type nucleoside diphosphatase (YffH/AdpP family)